MSNRKFADDWVTSGWSHGPDGKWIELGQSATVHMSGTPTPPELTVHDVAGKLNQLEDEVTTLASQNAEMLEDLNLLNEIPGLKAECTQLRQERDDAQARMKWIAEWYDEDDPRCAGVRAAMRVGEVELVCTEIDAARGVQK